MADILCPNCGNANPAERENCSFCGNPLHESDTRDSIRPGQAPTKKITAELEPILPQWLRDARQKARDNAQQTIPESERVAVEKPAQEPAPDLLAGLEASARQDESDELPDWLRGMSGSAPAPRQDKAEESLPSRRQEIRWEQEPAEAEAAPEPIADAEGIPAWMRGGQESNAEPQDFSDWLAQRPEPAAPPPPAPEPTRIDSVPGPETSAPGEVPSWLKVDQAAQTPAAEKSQPDLPDWMKNESPAPAQPSPTSATVLPDWLEAMKPSPPPASEPISAPAFVPADDFALSGLNMEELLSVEMPDWLSNIAPTDKSLPPAQADDKTVEGLSPASLPSWVQAMRPVENVLPGFRSPSANEPRENEGPLAGLSGVLPAAPGFVPSGKPRAQSIRLQPSDIQQSGAALLEQILANETTVRPMRAAARVATQRTLRWSLAALLLTVVGLSLLGGTRLVPLPGGLSPESAGSLGAIDSLADGAPVLMIFDYEPALAAEVEAASAALTDAMLGLRHPRLVLVSSAPTGPALIERFFKGTAVRQSLQTGGQVVNLGYLAGGTTGIRAFAENPRAAKPFDAFGRPAWESSATSGLHALSDFELVILLTDQSEAARAWLEQSASLRGGRPWIVISSAQSAPLIQPYLASGQITALVSGLPAGASFETQTSGVGGPARRYWESYNLALAAMLSVIVLGAAWNLAAGARLRRSEGMQSK